MKRFRLLLLLLLPLFAFGQQDVYRTKPVLPSSTSGNFNKQAVHDANVALDFNLRIPQALHFTLNNAKDSIGYIMLATDIGKMGIYKGGGLWDTVATGHSAAGNFLPLSLTQNTRVVSNGNNLTFDQFFVTAGTGTTPPLADSSLTLINSAFFKQWIAANPLVFNPAQFTGNATVSSPFSLLHPFDGRKYLPLNLTDTAYVHNRGHIWYTDSIGFQKGSLHFFIRAGGINGDAYNRFLNLDPTEIMWTSLADTTIKYFQLKIGTDTTRILGKPISIQTPVTITKLTGGTPLYNVLIDANGRLITGAVPVGGGALLNNGYAIKTFNYTGASPATVTADTTILTSQTRLATNLTGYETKADALTRFLTLVSPNQTITQHPFFQNGIKTTGTDTLTTVRVNGDFNFYGTNFYDNNAAGCNGCIFYSGGGYLSTTTNFGYNASTGTGWIFVGDQYNGSGLGTTAGTVVASFGTSDHLAIKLPDMTAAQRLNLNANIHGNGVGPGVLAFQNNSLKGMWELMTAGDTTSWRRMLNTDDIPGGGIGTVTNVTATNSGGFTWTITNSTTTPNLALVLQNATASQSGQLTSTDWNTFNGKQAAGNYITALTGDGTAAGPGSVALTLATVNGNVGTFGSSTSIPTFTVNAKGLITAASGNAVIAPAGTLSGTVLNSTVVTSSLTSANLASLTATDATLVFSGAYNGNAARTVGIASSVALAGNPTTTTQSPLDNSTKISTTAYTDAAVSAAVLGQDFKEAAKYATTSALPSIVYNNGSSGVGATLTGVGFGAISIDGSTPSVGDRLLVKNQVSTYQNGIYTVTIVGTVSTVFVLTRSADFNQSAEIKTGSSAFVTSGTANSTTTWAVNSADNPVMGTDAITFAQVAGQGSFTGGNGITITGTSIAINTAVTVDKTTAQALTNKDISSTTNTYASLTSAAFANTGTTTQVLHGNASGNLSFSQVSLVNDVTGNLSVNNLNSGTSASNTTFWRGDGTWATPGYPTGANPTATLGLSAVNGSATTFMRSDAAPALSQAIIPTWIGLHTFQAGATLSGNQTVAAWGNNTITSVTSPQLYSAATTLTDNTTANGTTLTYSGGTVLQPVTLASTHTTDVITNAGTLVIGGNAIAGTNITITNAYGLINAGNELLQGTLTNSSLGTGLVHSSSAGVFTSSLLVNADITAGTIANSSLANSTISGISLGSNLNTLTFGTHLTSGGSSYNGSANVTMTTDATATPTASVLSLWDANVNMSANNFLVKQASITAAAGTTTLAVGDNQQQYVTGSTTQTIKLPVTSTLTLGQSYTIINQSTGNVTVQSSGGNTIQQSLATHMIGTYICVLTSGTTAASWTVIYSSEVSTGTGNLVFSSNPTLAGTVGGSLTFSGTIVTSASTTSGRPLIQKAGTAAINSSATATAGNVGGGCITSTSAAATTITMPTATQLGTQLNATQGTMFMFSIDNTAGANTVTVAVGSGMTAVSAVTGGTTLTVPSGQAGVFMLLFSSATVCQISRIQ